MALSNNYTITVDLKRNIATATQTPIFVSNDTAFLYIKVLEAGKLFDYSNASRITVSFRRPDKVNIQGLAQYDAESGMIKYQLGTQEMEVAGVLETVVQIYMGDTRVSTRSFSVKIVGDFEEAIESSKDLTLLQELFLELDVVRTDTITAKNEANSAALYARNIRDNFGHKGEYDNTKVYKDGNVVSYGGINYMCILETTAGINPLNGTYWTVVSPQATINEQTWTATEGQRTFTLTNGKYVVGKGNIEVVVGGVRQLKDQGYGESSETTITLTEGVPAGTIVYAKWFEGHMYIAKGHQSSHAKGGQDEIDVTQLKNFKEKVTDEFTNVTSQLADMATDVTSLESSKLDKTGSIAVTQIDKNKGLIDQTYLTDELKQQIAGTAPINAVPADNSITTQKLTFKPLIGKLGKNLFNKSTVLLDKYISAANGSVQNSVGFTASDWISIQPNTQYSLYKRNQIAFYDTNKTYISFSDNTTATTVLSPANAVYMRITTITADIDLQQLEAGATRTEYERYGTYLDEETVRPLNGNKLLDNTVPKSKLTFSPVEAEMSKNLFNKSTVTTGKYVSSVNGGVQNSTGFSVSDWISIQPSTQYTISKYNQTAIYDSNKAYVASAGGTANNGIYTFTTPANGAFLRMTTTDANLDIQQLELGASTTTYEAFGARIPQSLITNKSLPDGVVTPEKLSFTIGKYDEVSHRLLLPPKMFFVDDLPLPLYKDNIFADNSVNLSSIFKTALINVDFNNGYNTTIQYFNEDIKLEATKLLNTFTIGVKQYTNTDYNYFSDISKSSVAANSKSGRTPKIINIGDSLTNRNVPQRLRDKLATYGVTASMQGTMANTGGVNGEGREGWTFSQFIGKSNYYGSAPITRQTTAGAGSLQTNPFLKLADANDIANRPDWCFRNTGSANEKSYTADTDKTGNFYIFDFAYYLNTQGFTIPDVVTIALSTNGISDLSGNRLALEVMVKQIKTACPNCKIGVIPTGAWGSNTTGNNTWKNYVVPWLENSMTDIKTYQSTITDLYIVPIWCHVNRDFNFPYSSTSALSSLNSSKKATRTEYIHWGESGKAEYANALTAFVMNVI